ncbi:hypothetical protein FG465_002976 [Yersinia enterocolitica]|nr:hypothetical protein [Yersinia enterocolitica]HEI6776921.1 hypothetical protein [Yersinia enterocolitica]HEI6781178.1 hypothetical protein [Yersinia enterocolitica]HEI6840377.1 hypothetical protein [Yersinia enterocolitica]HEI6878254.1 hypothetical protein [Yersinia enterocolitica]
MVQCSRTYPNEYQHSGYCRWRIKVQRSISLISFLTRRFF